MNIDVQVQRKKKVEVGLNRGRSGSRATQWLCGSSHCPRLPVIQPKQKDSDALLTVPVGWIPLFDVSPVCLAISDQYSTTVGEPCGKCNVRGTAGYPGGSQDNHMDMQDDHAALPATQSGKE